ncbi:MAG: hypothetical protein ACXVB9_12295 [Bdellovibrionota bacterium]
MKKINKFLLVGTLSAFSLCSGFANACDDCRGTKSDYDSYCSENDIAGECNAMNICHWVGSSPLCSDSSVALPMSKRMSSGSDSNDLSQ